MLHKCANPACLTAFRSLGQGKLFQIESKYAVPRRESPGRRVRVVSRVERYWLCDRCSRSLTLAPERGGGVTAIPLPAFITATFGASQI
jgi:hypothetical protein